MPTTQTFPRSPETIVLSDEERSQVEACLAALSRDGESRSVVSPQLTTSDEIVDLSPELAELLRRLLAALAQGQGVSLVPLHRQLTTQEAADLLNVSRPTLVKVLERGDLPFTLTGRHRRIRLDDLLKYQAEIEERRDKALQALREEAEEEGLYELLDGAHPTRTR